MNFDAFNFGEPLWFCALLVLPLLWWLRGRRRVSVLFVPFAAAWHRPSLATLSRWPAVFAIIGLTLIVIGLARPQRVEDRHEVNTKGYDIMLAIDLSGSMLAEDYEARGARINRLQAVKPVIQAFIDERSNDRIGIVVFAGRAYTMAPLTFDHAWLEKQLERLKPGMIEDRTAIGDGLGVALTRLEQTARQKEGLRQGAFVVLLTDGANNHGALTPNQAATIAKSRGVAVYTIGAGQTGIVPMPVFDEKGNRVGTRRMLSDLDENALREIAEMTSGRYFRAADSDTVKDAFEAIDQAKKIEFQSKSFLVTTELFPWVAAPGMALLFVGALLARQPWSKETTS
jgi:Ca-activated chloride channel family protein